jgi:hypothetical protein
MNGSSRTRLSYSVKQPPPEVGRAEGEQPFKRAIDSDAIARPQGLDPPLDVTDDLFPIVPMQANGLLEKSIEEIQHGLFEQHREPAFAN